MIVFVNGVSRDVERAAQLLDVLDLTSEGVVPRGIAVAVDGLVVPRAEVASTELREGARVEIVTAVQGG